MKTQEELQQMLDETVNTLLGQHRGRVDIVSIDAHPDDAEVRHVNVKMSGGCQGCAGAKATLRTIVTNYLQEFDGSINEVIDVTDHSNRENAFFKD